MSLIWLIIHQCPLLHVDVEWATDLKIIQPVMGKRRRASLITHESGVLREDPPRSFHAWAPYKGLIKLRKGDKTINSPK